MHVIEMDPADNFGSLRVRLLQSGRDRVVLIAPSPSENLRRIDLVLLRRLIDQERLKVAIVTPNRATATEARAMGIPAFSSLIMAEYYRPGWWRARRARAVVGLPPGEKHLPASQSEPSAMATIPIALAVAAMLLTSLIALALLILPQARITLRPETRQVQIITEITADSFLTEPAAAAVPARLLHMGQPWVAEGPATASRTDDHRRLRAQALQALNSEADGLLAVGLASGEWLVPGSSRVVVTDESLESGREGLRRLTLQTDLTGLAVDRQDVGVLVTRRMAAITPGGFTFSPGSLAMSLDSIPGRMDSFRVTAGGRVRAEIDTRWLQDVLRGQTSAEAFRILEELPLEDGPRIDMLPIWRAALFDRLPLLARGLHIELLP